MNHKDDFLRCYCIMSLAKRVMEMKEILMNEIKGFRIGHSHDFQGATGCTVVLCPEGATAGVDVGGGAPGTRETDLLNPVNMVDQVHGVVLAGGSAYGLDAAGGVMKYLEEKGYGFDVKVAKVPIVCSAVLFDLAVGNAFRRPDAAMGYQACENAGVSPLMVGSIGAGTGATIGKLKGYTRAMKGGIGFFALEIGRLKVHALVAVNAFGDVVNPATGERVAGLLREDKKALAGTEETMILDGIEEKVSFSGNTSLGVVMTNAKITKTQATKVASMAQDGFARSIRPCHTMVDGDTIFVLGTGETPVDGSLLGTLAAKAIEGAVLNAVTNAEGLFGIPGIKDLENRLLW